MHSTWTLPDSLKASVLRKFRCKLLQNYTSWCSYFGRKSQVSVSRRRNGTGNSETNSLHRELLYVSLYLLIWVESADCKERCLFFFGRCLPFFFFFRFTKQAYYYFFFFFLDLIYFMIMIFIF